MLALCQKIAQDETSLRFRGQDWKDSTCKAAASTLKVVQSRTSVHVLCKKPVVPPQPAQFFLFNLRLTAPLQTVDHGTGEGLLAAVSETMELPMLGHMRDVAECHYEVQVGDGAAANSKAFRGRGDGDKMLYRTSCFAHKVSTVTGRSYQVVDGLLSGVIALALSLAPGGAMDSLRTVIAEILQRSLVVHKVLPPLPHHAHAQRRDEFLKLLLPATPLGLQRKVTLQTSMHGDLDADEIVLCKIGGAAEEERKQWAKEVAVALLPHNIQTFSRTRWLNRVDSISDVALLAGTHNLLQRALPVWHRYMKGEKLSRIFSAMPAAASSNWNISDSESEVCEDAKPGPNSWQAWNRLQRRDACRLAKCKGTRGGLVVTVKVLQPMTQLLHRIEHLGTDKWLCEQQAASISGGVGKTLGEEVAGGAAESACVSSLLALMIDTGTWSEIGHSDRTQELCGIAFCMLSRMACGVHQLMQVPLREWSVQMFRIIHDPTVAQALRASPACMQDEFTVKFLQRWNTVQRLRSPACLSELTMLSSVAAWNNCDIECSFASIRRRVVSRVQTHQDNLQSGSAAFVLMQARSWVHGTPHKKTCRGRTSRRPNTTANTRKRRVRKKGRFKGKVAGGGGRRRAALSEKMRAMWQHRRDMGMKGCVPKEKQSRMFREAHQRTRDARPEDFQRWEHIGQAGTASHKVRGKPIQEPQDGWRSTADSETDRPDSGPPRIQKQGESIQRQGADSEMGRPGSETPRWRFGNAGQIQENSEGYSIQSPCRCCLASRCH